MTHMLAQPMGGSALPAAELQCIEPRTIVIEPACTSYSSYCARMAAQTHFGAALLHSVSIAVGKQGMRCNIPLGCDDERTDAAEQVDPVRDVVTEPIVREDWRFSICSGTVRCQTTPVGTNAERYDAASFGTITYSSWLQLQHVGLTVARVAAEAFVASCPKPSASASACAHLLSKCAAHCSLCASDKPVEGLRYADSLAFARNMRTSMRCRALAAQTSRPGRSSAPFARAAHRTYR